MTKNVELTRGDVSFALLYFCKKLHDLSFNCNELAGVLHPRHLNLIDVMLLCKYIKYKNFNNVDCLSKNWSDFKVYSRSFSAWKSFPLNKNLSEHEAELVEEIARYIGEVGKQS